MAHPRSISADDLALCLVVRRSASPARWAAMSNGVKTQACDTSSSTRWGVKHGPLFSPMDRGRIDLAIERARLSNRDEVRRTFGVGIKALRAETASACMQRGAR